MQSLERARESGRVEQEGWRVRKNRSTFWASVSLIALRDEQGHLAGFGKVTRDLTLRRQAEEHAVHLAEERVARASAETAQAQLEAFARRTMQLQDVTAAFAKALTSEQVRRVIFERVLRAFGSDSGCLAAVEDDGQTLCLLWASAESGTAQPPGRHVFPANHPHSLAARTLSPVFLESPDAIAASFNGGATIPSGAQALASLPLIIGRRCIGVLGVSWQAPRIFTIEDRQLALALTQQCVQAIERVRAFEEERRARGRAEAAERRLMLLAEASRVLSSSLDYDATLKRLANLTVPWLADWCSIELVNEEGVVEQRANLTCQSAGRHAHELFRRHPRNPKSDRGVSRVLHTGMARKLWPDISDGLLAPSCAAHTDQLSTWRELGFRSAIMAPLKAGERILGAMTLIGAESGRRFAQADLQLAQEVANRAALAIENARLYREARAAIQRRDEFLSVASHELRTPVTALELQVSTLLRSMDAERISSWSRRSSATGCSAPGGRHSASSPCCPSCSMSAGSGNPSSRWSMRPSS